MPLNENTFVISLFNQSTLPKNFGHLINEIRTMSVQFKKRGSGNKSLRSKKDEDEEEDATIINKVELKSSTKPITYATAPKKNSDSKLTATTVYESSKEIVPQAYAGDATHTSEIDTATERDARTILERNIKLNMDGVPDDEPNVYRGQAGYRNFVKKDMSQVGANKFTGTQGPIRAPAFLRSSCRFDYQPDICKDYKETGFCGYGDNCKFLHDRGDYKSGWQLEKEWDSMQAKKKKKLEDSIANFAEGEGDAAPAGGDAEDDDEENFAIDDDEELPFACHICREDFKAPVVTVCGHYFCGQCILGSSKKHTKCPICDKQTFGVFNVAHKLIRKLQKSAKLAGGGGIVVSVASQAVRRPRSSGFVEVVEEAAATVAAAATLPAPSSDALPTASLSEDASEDDAAPSQPAPSS